MTFVTNYNYNTKQWQSEETTAALVSYALTRDIDDGTRAIYVGY